MLKGKTDFIREARGITGCLGSEDGLGRKTGRVSNLHLENCR